MRQSSLVFMLTVLLFSSLNMKAIKITADILRQLSLKKQSMRVVVWSIVQDDTNDGSGDVDDDNVEAC